MSPKVTYEVWEELSNGTLRRRHPGDQGLPSKRLAKLVAKNYNEAEAELRRIEQRKTGTKYVVVKATTSFELK